MDKKSIIKTTKEQIAAKNKENLKRQKGFLENGQLYTKFDISFSYEIPTTGKYNNPPKVNFPTSINLDCEVCGEKRTFRQYNLPTSIPYSKNVKELRKKSFLTSLDHTNCIIQYIVNSVEFSGT